MPPFGLPKALVFGVFAFTAAHLSLGATPNENLREFFNSQFRAYPAAPAEQGLSKGELQWKTDWKARRYRTLLKKEWAAAKEPNFAGHYFAVPGIGCGAPCAMIFIVDWHTGKIFYPPRDDVYEFHKDSRLLVLRPYDECTLFGPPILYAFDGENFKVVEHDKCKKAGS